VTLLVSWLRHSAVRWFPLPTVIYISFMISSSLANGNLIPLMHTFVECYQQSVDHDGQIFIVFSSRLWRPYVKNTKMLEIHALPERTTIEIRALPESHRNRSAIVGYCFFFKPQTKYFTRSNIPIYL